MEAELARHLGIVMDPIESINPKKDSTFAMMLAAQKRGWQISVMTLEDLSLNKDVLTLNYQTITVRDDPRDYFQSGGFSKGDATVFDLILMRKDPPFDMAFVYATYLLDFAERSGTPVFNRPSSIRDCNEKLFALQFPNCVPEVIVTSNPEALRGFHDEHQDIILKPLDGMGGQSIFRVKAKDTNRNVIIETLTEMGTRKIMAQRFIPEIKDGDTRILLINGEPISYGLARIPSAGETRGNLAAGGSGVARPLTDRDRWICNEVGPTLREKGLLFVGIDVIGDYLTEINVTCPTCIRELDASEGLDIAGDYLDHLEEQIG
jgi:glutathione synthase